jgi:hypothetical protein
VTHTCGRNDGTLACELPRASQPVSVIRDIRVIIVIRANRVMRANRVIRVVMKLWK